MAPPTLAGRLQPCGPILDRAMADRCLETLSAAAGAGGWGALLGDAWAALAPVFSASPYLAGLARTTPGRLEAALGSPPEVRLARILEDASAAAALGVEAGAARLRRLKGDLHLLTALADLGGVWDLDEATGALSRFADAATTAALALAAQELTARGRLRPGPAAGDAGPAPGLFVIAMGKHGAHELNYSSDIDISVFYEPSALPAAPGVEPQAAAIQLTQALARILQERTADGYVFRVDLRLRPDPSVTPVAAPVDPSLDYYEAVGQNWERAAYIKARPCAGDLARARAFLQALEPFVWRRNLDFAAIADIHSIKRQIHIHKTDERLTAAGVDLKLGAGGIREIEFYVQTQQLILGGRDPALRSARTLDALAALARAGHVSEDAARELSQAYRTLRALEHRVQMVGDEQTHRLPEAEQGRRRVAALSGEADLGRFDAEVERTLRTVNRRYGELFAGDEPLSSPFGSLVFTGVEDDPETLATLGRMGFANRPQVSATIRAWHHGRINATRTERGRELFTRLAPRLLDAARATGAPDVAFTRFAVFFSGLSSGVQVQSLFLAQPRLLELIVRVMAFAPQLAATLARMPAALDAMLDASFLKPPDEADARQLEEAAGRAEGFEAAMDAVRRAHREQSFRIGVQVISGLASAPAAGRAFADLADACIRSMSVAALTEAERLGGAFPGEVAVVALGKCGSREMTARSDLDLMTLYRTSAPQAASALRQWSAETFYTRFTQRLTAALSAPTAEGELYKVDLQLRPSGTSGPVAVSLNAFEGYYRGRAETWEFLALTRARVVWASSPDFAQVARSALEAALRQHRDPRRTARDVLDMRALMERERPPSGVWDLKLSRGGFVDIEFAAQHLQIVHAHANGPLFPNTADALDALDRAGAAPPGRLGALKAAWSLQQDLSQLLKIALPDDADPAAEPGPFRAMLAAAAGAKDFDALVSGLKRRRERALDAFRAIVRP